METTAADNKTKKIAKVMGTTIMRTPAKPFRYIFGCEADTQ